MSAKLKRYTMGSGVRSPGKVQLIEPPQGVEDMAAELSYLPSKIEAWWSPHVWRGNVRKEAAWESSCGLVLEADHYDTSGEQAEIPTPLFTRLMAGAKNRQLPGNLFYATPRGFRLVFIWPEQNEDEGLQRKAGPALAKRAERALRDLDLARDGVSGGFAVDLARASDLGHFTFSPSAIVRGHIRRVEVVVMERRTRETPAEAAGIPAVEGTTPARVGVERSADPEMLASAAYIRAQTRDWEELGGLDRVCPMCQQLDSFGPLSGDPGLWHCDSPEHGHESGGCGKRRADGSWVGDALDLDACTSGLSRRALLREGGYLRDRRLIDPAADVPAQGGELRAVRISPLSDVLENAVALVERRAEGSALPVSTGWSAVDQALGRGLWPGLHLCCGAPGNGKTQWALQVALSAARREQPVLYLASTRARDRLGVRLAGLLLHARWHESGAEATQRPPGWGVFYHGEIEDRWREQYRQAIADLRALPVHVDLGGAAEDASARLLEGAREVRMRYPALQGSGSLPLLVIFDGCLLEPRPGASSAAAPALTQLIPAARAVAETCEAVVLVIASLDHAGQRALKEERAQATFGNGDPRRLLALDAATAAVAPLVDTFGVLALGRGSTEATAAHLGLAKLRSAPARWLRLSFDGTGFREQL